jgi:hypothetical protein
MEYVLDSLSSTKGRLHLPEGSLLRRSAQGFHEVVAARGFSHSDSGSFNCTKSKKFFRSAQAQVLKLFHQCTKFHLRAVERDSLLMAQVGRILGSDEEQQQNVSGKPES